VSPYSVQREKKGKKKGLLKHPFRSVHDPYWRRCYREKKKEGEEEGVPVHGLFFPQAFIQNAGSTFEWEEGEEKKKRKKTHPCEDRLFFRLPVSRPARRREKRWKRKREKKRKSLRSTFLLPFHSRGKRPAHFCAMLTQKRGKEESKHLATMVRSSFLFGVIELSLCERTGRKKGKKREREEEKAARA